MNRTATCLAGLLLVGGLLPPRALAHSDTGQHLPPFTSTYNDDFDPECGDGGPCRFGDNDPGTAPLPGVSGGPTGWYYGSASAWLETQAQASGFSGAPPPFDGSSPPIPGLNGVGPGFSFAAAFAFCDAEVLGDGTAPSPLDEAAVDGSPGGSAPDGTFNDGGFGAVCHMPASFYGHPPYNSPGCSYGNAQALDIVSGEDVWITTSCDWLTPAAEAAALDHVLELSTCAANAVLAGDVPGGATACANTFVGCAVAGAGCPSTGASFCGADGVGDASESGSGDAGGGGSADGVPFPAGPYRDSHGRECVDSAASVFAWDAAVVDFSTRGHQEDPEDPALEAVSAAVHGWIQSGGTLAPLVFEECSVPDAVSSAVADELRRLSILQGAGA